MFRFHHNPTQACLGALMIATMASTANADRRQSLNTTDPTFGLESGACCVGFNCVSDVSELECSQLNGSWQGDLTSCLDVECFGTAPGDECQAAFDVTDGSYFGDLADNTGPSGDDDSCGDGNTIDEWYCYTATCTGRAIVTTCGPDTEFDTVLSAFDACNGNEIACNDDYLFAIPPCDDEPTDLTSYLTFSVVAGQQYYVRVSPYEDLFGFDVGEDDDVEGEDGSLYQINFSCVQDCNDNGIPDDQDIAGVEVLYSIPRFGGVPATNGPGFPDLELLIVDPLTAASLSSLPLNLPGHTIESGYGLTAGPTGDDLWAVIRALSDGGGGGATGTAALGGQQLLVRIDPTSGFVTVIGGLDQVFAAIAFDDAGNLFGVTGNADPLLNSVFQIDPADATSVLICSFVRGGGGQALALNVDDLLLYRASGDGPRIFETIDGPGSTSCATTPRDPVSQCCYRAKAITYWPSQGYFLYAGFDTDKGLPGDGLFNLSAAGEETYVGNLDHETKGLAFLFRQSMDEDENGVPDECEFAPADQCVQAPLACPGVTHVGDNLTATNDYLAGVPGATVDSIFFCGFFFGIYDVWYCYRPAWSGLVFVRVEDPNDVGTEWTYGVYEDCEGTPDKLIECNDSIHHEVIFWAEQGEDYYIRIAGRYFERGYFEMDIVGPDCAFIPGDNNNNGIPDDQECLADVNNDGFVDLADYLQVLDNLGPCAGCPEDVDGSGVVDQIDQQQVLLNYGPCPNPF